MLRSVGAVRGWDADMLDHLAELAALLTQERPEACAVATIVDAGGSTPRSIGTSMLVSESGRVVGSLSGGCVEGAVFDACQQAISAGTPSLERFGFSDEDAFAVGLTCGGSLDVFIHPVLPHSPVAERIRAAVTGLGQSPVLIRRIDGGGNAERVIVVPDAADFDMSSVHSGLAALVGDELLAEHTFARVAALVRAGRTGKLRLDPTGPDCAEGSAETALVTLFVETRRTKPRMFVFGANDFSAALLNIARTLGYHTVLCDARPAFTSPDRFPEADEVVVEWPHRYLARAAESGLVDECSAICVLTHDPKFDIPLLTTALTLDAEYVGAMGSRRSDEQRRSALRECGVTPPQLARLRSPIGLDLGAVTPEEVAVSIVAELIGLRHQRPAALPLSRSSVPIHASAEQPE